MRRSTQKDVGLNVRQSRRRRQLALAGHRGSRVEQLEDRHLLTGNPIVTVDTNFGKFQIELFPSAAPATVGNFLTYVDDRVYNDSIFHRSVPGSVEQTGGYLSASTTFSNTSQFVPMTTNAAIPLEYNVPNTLGTVAMARTSSPNSATSQWFVNLTDNSNAFKPGGSDPYGYAVFGVVINGGMSVLQAISSLPVDNADNGTFSQLPLGTNNQLVVISSIAVDSIDGTVFTDLNANGQLEAGEPALAGRTVFINNDGSGVPDANNPSTVTDVNGNYTFTGLAPGSYTVQEVLPANASLTTPVQTVTVSANQTASGVNFGERPSISGTVFTDFNNTGHDDTGDLGVSGRTVFLNNDSSGVPDANNPSTTTNASGNYYFVNLAPGSYTVVEVVPAGVTLTTPASKTVTVASGQTALSVNFGEAPSPLSSNQRFVIQVYHDLLGRNAEPAALQYWPTLIAGGQPRSAVVLDIEESQEYHNDVVNGLFQLYLHRAADSAALSGGSAFLAAGGTPEQLSADLVGSPEYFQTRGGSTNLGFLNAIFADALHRAPDAATVNALAADDFSQQSVRLAAADAIFGSNEYLSDLVNYPTGAKGSSGFVPFGWYPAYLGREAEGTAVASITTMIHAGIADQQVIAGILGSDEYFGRAQSATE
ncbi:MAG TPA: peptidylprolyl isomerase [Pirellulales bacterium]|jgi:cyclophilin family peptidyl-prolyl cis-trans isomerase|nr:peptidylprolyl isomerase [Pirellulales bacterium]